jgi:hypothetical protein
MPIAYTIDHARRLVDAAASGILSREEIFRYQREAWSRPEVAGYNELVDMTDVTQISEISREGISNLAELSAAMDAPGVPSKFAIVARADLHFGLGRMYQSFRESNQQSTKSVGVFRTREEAKAWLEQPGPAIPGEFFVQDSHGA